MTPGGRRQAITGSNRSAQISSFAQIRFLADKRDVFDADVSLLNLVYPAGDVIRLTSKTRARTARLQPGAQRSRSRAAEDASGAMLLQC